MRLIELADERTQFHACGCSVLTSPMRRTPEGTFVEVIVPRTEHSETCKFKRRSFLEVNTSGLRARGADGDMPSDMVGNWSTPVSAPNGPTQITWNLEADSRHLWSLGEVLHYPRDYFRLVWRKRRAELDNLK